MAKCRVCRQDQGIWAWQPFGPGDVRTFTLEGNHYRSYPVIKICESCKCRFEAGSNLIFTYVYKLYKVNRSGLIARHCLEGWDVLKEAKAAEVREVTNG